jgi:cytochrome b561
MSVRGSTQGYSATQIMLHWTVALLVAFQFFLNHGIGDAFRAIMGGEEPTGLLILMLALWRIVLRLTLGAPPAPENEGPLLRRVAKITHVALYVLILLVPLSGAAAWFGTLGGAAAAHNILKLLLLAVVLLHIAGALVQHFVFRSDVLMRMLMTRD